MIKFAKDNPQIAVGAKKHEVKLAFTDRLIEANVAKLMSYRVVSMQTHGLIPNHEASMCKLFSSELQQRIAALSMHLLGTHGVVRNRVSSGYVNAVSSTIAGGTSEVQKGIIATRGLGLPRGWPGPLPAARSPSSGRRA